MDFSTLGAFEVPIVTLFALIGLRVLETLTTLVGLAALLLEDATAPAAA